MGKSAGAPGDAAGPALRSISARPSKEERPAGSGRVEFLSATRGAALLYIVIDHAHSAVDILTPAPRPASWEDFSKSFETFDNFTAGTRLAVLVFLTGLFVERSLARGLGRFIALRATTLVWPLLLWGGVQTLLYIWAPWTPDFYRLWTERGFSEAAHGLTSLNLLDLLHGGGIMAGPMWFLGMLIIFLSLYLVLRWLPSKGVLAGAILAFCYALLYYSRSSHVTNGVVVMAPYFLYFWLGTMAFDWVVRHRARISPTQAALCMVAFLAVALPPALTASSQSQLFGFVASLPTIPLLLNAGKVLVRTPLRSFFLWVGDRSLLILCLHFFFELSALALARSAGVSSPLIVLAISLASALGGCFLADQTFRRLGWSTALGFRLAN